MANIILRRSTFLIPRFTRSLKVGLHGRNKLSYSNSHQLVLPNLPATGENSVQTPLRGGKPWYQCQKTLPFSRDNVISRSFATGFPFRHDENLNAVRLLFQLPNYKNLLFQLEENMSDVDGHLQSQVFQQGQAASNSVVMKVEPAGKTWRSSLISFIEAAYISQEAQLTVTHPKNQEVVETVLKDLKVLTDEELSHLLYHVRFFAPCPSSKDPKYMKVWQAIDAECLARNVTWNLDYSFVIADLWYGLGLARMSEFHWNLMKKLFRRCDKLPREHFVRFMFCLNLNRSLPPNFSPYDLEYRLSKIVDQLTAEEVVIIAMAFFKTQIPIRDPELVNKLLEIAMKKSDSLDSISVAAIAKLARYSATHPCSQTLLEFQEKFIPEIPRLSITACTHLTLVGTNTLTPHKDMIKMVVNRIEENIVDTRLKELDRIALSTTMFNVECDKLLGMLVEELKRPERADEIRKYGRSLPPLLHYLSIKEIFIPDLISTVLSKTFRTTYYGKEKETFQRELLCLDIAADIELPEYTGHRLEPKIFNVIMKKNMLWIKPPSKVKVPVYERFLRVVVEAVEQVFDDSEFFLVANILPQHHTMAIVYCRDKDGNFAKIPQEFVDFKPYEIKRIPPKSELTYYALLIWGRNAYLQKSNELTGQATLQLRQTKKLGYKTNMVSLSDWESVTADDPLKLTKHIARIIKDTDEK